MMCDVAIVGAGPYGLSLAAHLAAQGIGLRIFGKPLDTWRAHMPKDMHLKSEGFASSLAAPDADSTLKAYCAARGIAYADQHLPVSLTLFNEYAEWFRTRYVPMLEESLVTGLARQGDAYRVTLDTGESFTARHVVLAVGITAFANMPDEIARLPNWARSHSYEHREGFPFNGQEVAVIGGGASAVDLAALLHDCGARPTVIARREHIYFHNLPDPGEHSLLSQLQKPSSAIGPGWKSFMCVHAPLLFHAMPERLRLRATQRHLGPAPGWFMRERVIGKIPLLTGQRIDSLRADGAAVHIGLKSEGGVHELAFDHVIAATGYRPTLARIGFLDAALRDSLAAVEGTPKLSENFETTARGLYAMGPLAANAFGPLMRFMVGAEFAAPRLAAHLVHRIGARRLAQAA